jgi:hypothetical protein
MHFTEKTFMSSNLCPKRFAKLFYYYFESFWLNAKHAKINVCLDVFTKHLILVFVKDVLISSFKEPPMHDWANDSIAIINRKILLMNREDPAEQDIKSNKIK